MTCLDLFATADVFSSLSFLSPSCPVQAKVYATRAFLELTFTLAALLPLLTF